MGRVDELLEPGGEWMGRGDQGDRGSCTRRWAWYRLGAFMCSTDTGRIHGPQVRP